MGLIDAIVGPVSEQIAQRGYAVVLGGGFVAAIVLSVVVNVLQQILFKNPNEPPVVFHYFPLIGSTITYGMDPYKFFFDNTAKYGDIFTFVLLGKKTTVYLGTAGNEFILNAKIRDVNAEEIYSPLTTPVFGTDVVYDCPNAKLMEQKKFMKINLSTESFRSYVPVITAEVEDFVKKSPFFKGASGTVDICPALAELTIYTASRSLQGKEVRARFNSTFAALYHDLDMGFTPINFQFNWAPLPQNRARDHAQRTIANTYMEIIQARRAGPPRGDGEIDMIWHLMESVYKDGTAVPDKEIAHMMIALLMAGQHSSSSTSAWMILRLASRPDIQEELYAEQKKVLGENFRALKYEDLSNLPLHQAVLKETLRMHTPIHSIMRKVKTPMPVAGTPYVVPTSHILLSSPGYTSRVDDYFPNPDEWDPHRWDPESSGVRLGNVKEEIEDYGYGAISKGASSPYLPFGAGRHRCIGEQFAGVQLNTIVAKLVQDFKFKLPANAKGEVVGTDYASLFSRPLAPAVVEWERREKV